MNGEGQLLSRSGATSENKGKLEKELGWRVSSSFSLPPPLKVMKIMQIEKRKTEEVLLLLYPKPVRDKNERSEN